MHRLFFIRLLGLRQKRNIAGKEVIIQDPDYIGDARTLTAITQQIHDYAHTHHLMRIPNVVNVFFRYQPDHEMERISETLEAVIEDLSNTRDRYILSYLNKYPIVSLKAHTRPFERKWLNVLAALVFPVGIILYFRMWRFRLRLYGDLRQIRTVSNSVIGRVEELYGPIAQEEQTDK